VKACSGRTHFANNRQNQRIGRHSGEPIQHSFRPIQKAPNRKHPVVQGVNSLVKRRDGLLNQLSLHLQGRSHIC
jgi:hypothetical protein